MANKPPPPTTRLTIRNWRKRADQMDNIAESVSSGSVHDTLHRKAEEMRRVADEAERKIDKDTQG